MSSLSLPVVNLMPGIQWAVLKEEKVLALLVEVRGEYEGYYDNCRFQIIFI